MATSSVAKFYNKLSIFGKILVWLAIFLLVVIFAKNGREGMITSKEYSHLDGKAVYDEFYVNIYDQLTYSAVKNAFEVGAIINTQSPQQITRIADIGCGTGHMVGSLAAQHYQVIGVDNSPAMIAKARENYPSVEFEVGDATDDSLFQPGSLTHILCLYFTIYYISDKQHFINGVYRWLMPGGYFVVHLVDRETFDTILPPAQPMLILSPQRYAKERITKTKVMFDDFVYSANFDLNVPSNVATFDEKFKFNNGKTRSQQHKLYMEDTAQIVDMAQNAGFILHAKIDMVKCAYEGQYLYVFLKPA